MEKQANFSPMQRFFKLLQPDKKEIRNVYAYAVFNGLVSLSLPLGIQAIVNLIQGGQISTSWIVLVVFVVLGVAITGVLQIFQLRITENLQQRIFTRSAFEFAYRIPRIRLEVLYRHYAPELMNRFFDTVSVQKGLSKILIDFSAASLQVIFGLILLSFYHPFFILFSLVLILLVLAIFRFTAKKGLSTSLDESVIKYEVAHWLEELARASNTFKLAGFSSLPLNRMNKTLSGYLNARDAHFKVLVQQYSLLIVFKVVVATGLLAIGGILVMEQLMNIGQFIAAEIIILLVMNSVEKLILSLETIYDVLTALAKIGQVTDLEIENTEGMNIAEKGRSEGLSVEFQDVDFIYPGSHYKTLENASFQLRAGERILVTGQNNSGKSSLLRLLAGLYSAESGSITYDGLSKGNIAIDSLRSIIGDSLSQELIFDGTVAENISVGRPQATIDNVRWAAKSMGVDSYISTLPKGYDTQLDPLGKGLPGSIIKKILLARSIADKPRLLLIENDLEQINEIERKKIIDFLTSKENPWTLVVVSSDTFMINAVDRVLNIENGQIATIDPTSNTQNHA
ncbi:MAG: ATP-binding cassette domain-containing protein [Vicingaceae bacterium]